MLETLHGVCLDQITESFPQYPLDQIEKDIKQEFSATNADVGRLPKLASSVGGDTDFMFGMKFARYFPVEIFKMISGLTIYRSVFKNADGGYGVCGGPHSTITQIEQQYQGHTLKHFLSHLQASFSLFIDRTLDFIS